MMAHPAMGGRRGKDVRRPVRAWPVALTHDERRTLAQLLENIPDAASWQNLEATLSHYMLSADARLEDAHRQFRAAARRFLALYDRDADHLPGRQLLDTYCDIVQEQITSLPKPHRGPKRNVMRGLLVDGLREFFRRWISPESLTDETRAELLRDEDAFVRLAASFVGVTFKQKAPLPYQRNVAPP